ncbi:hypothetical protein MRU69_11840 [Kocuria flava]|uniref:hypothetical protein n=1 Tax=Kocuria flava TaxID=446860 RepID=UPI001FF273DB|nr:hypothetical protein [Kocuria flava]MCJ8505540.1 hypothetical protein [Kocuria flava]
MITDHSKIEHRGMQLASPEGKAVDVTSSVIDSEAWRIPELSETMGVPDNWSVWALAANPHGVAQRIYRDPDLPAGSFIHSFPSYVEKSILNAGETYYSWEKGVGVWSFNIPMPEDILLQSPSFQDITPRWWTRTEDGQWIGYFPGGFSLGAPDFPEDMVEAWSIPEYIGFEDYDGKIKGMPTERVRDKHMRILGIGVFSGGTNSTLIGFSPVAPESMARPPGDL